MKQQVEYVVLYFDPQGSPAVLARWLTGICRSEGLRLVSADNGYYIFERANKDEAYIMCMKPPEETKDESE